MIEVYKAGTTVQFTGTGISGIITAVTIRGESVQYEIGYWSERDYKVGWFIEEEFSVSIEWPKIILGFKK